MPELLLVELAVVSLPPADPDEFSAEKEPVDVVTVWTAAGDEVVVSARSGLPPKTPELRAIMPTVIMAATRPMTASTRAIVASVFIESKE